MSEKDFSHKNLQGCDFKGEDLAGANFSYADIRGANFTNANLTGAKFHNATSGLQRRWVITLIIIALLLSSLSGLVSSTAGAWTGYLLSSVTNDQVAGLIIITSSLFFIIIIIDEGLQAVLKALGITGAIAAILTMVGEITGNTSLPVSVMAGWAGFVLGTLGGIATMVLTLAVTTSATVFVIWGSAVGGSIALILAVTMAMVTSVIGTMSIEIVTGVGSLIVTLVMGGLSAYVSVHVARQALAGQEKHAFVREIAIAFATIGGTSFCSANLTDADFNQATLKSTDFRGATLTRTNWRKSKMLDRVRPGTTYLKNAKIHQVLITGQVDRTEEEKNFNHQNLRGVNLKGANLADASFIGADLSEANLQDADLSRAKLVQTQLDGTDFIGATLTGAYIEDWGITRETKFDGVRCEYVYMRLPTQEDPDPHRKPDYKQEMFADGEFGDFIKPIFDTLDLYHNQGVDPRAIAISFKQLAENHPDADLRIVGMEVRGEDKFLLRAKTAVTADKSELSAEYFDTYNEIKGLPEQAIKLLLAEKDSRILSLQNLVKTALQSPKFYAETYNNQGDTTVTGDRNINTGGGNYNERIRGDYVQGNYYATGEPQSLAQAAAEIQLLLKQLEQAYPTTTTSQQMVVAAEAINRIESNPLLKERVINAVKSGGLAAFEKAIDNPTGAFIVGAIKGWQEVEVKD